MAEHLRLLFFDRDSHSLLAISYLARTFSGLFPAGIHNNKLHLKNELATWTLH